MKVPEKLEQWKRDNPDRVKESAYLRVKRWRQNNPEKRQAQMKRSYPKKNAKYALSNKDYHRDRMLRYNYGITLEEYNNMAQEQNWACKICLGNTARALSVDHCHKSKKIRGLLCSKCNTAIGLLDEDISRLDKIKDYLS